MAGVLPQFERNLAADIGGGRSDEDLEAAGFGNPGVFVGIKEA